MVSTLEAFFSGKKDLFEGLYASTVDWEWKEYPILHLDLNVKKYETKEDLGKILNRHLEQWEQRYDSPYADRDLEERFLQVVECAYRKTGQRVVISPMKAHPIKQVYMQCDCNTGQRMLQ